MYNKLNKKAIWCMFISNVVSILVATLILSIVWIAVEENAKGSIVDIIKIGVSVILIVELIVTIISPKIRYERYRYNIDDEKIDIIEGFIFTERNIVPIKRLHKISINQGPIDRIFELSKVIVTTAGGDVVIRFLELKKAEEIAENLKNKINNYVLSEKEVKESERE